jgi:hypothetical protein
MSMLTIILLVEYYTLKQAAEIELVVKPVSMSIYLEMYHIIIVISIDSFNNI